MAWPFSGTINGTVDSASQGLPMLLDSFTLVNKSDVAIGVNVYKINLSSIPICIMPLNIQIDPSEMYQGDNQVVLLPTEVIRVKTSGQCDYDFKINNMVAEFTNGKL